MEDKVLVKVDIKKSMGVDSKTVTDFLASLVEDDPLLFEQHFEDYVRYAIVSKDSFFGRCFSEECDSEDAPHLKAIEESH